MSALSGIFKQGGMLVERNAAFDRCIDFLVRMMEKYSNEIVFLEEIPGNHQMSDGKK